jgi:hypothetical protein
MGPLKGVRLIKDQRQRSKGYAYVQCRTQEGLLRGLALDQTSVRGRIINVVRSNPSNPRCPKTEMIAGRKKVLVEAIVVIVLR